MVRGEKLRVGDWNVMVWIQKYYDSEPTYGRIFGVAATDLVS